MRFFLQYYSTTFFAFTCPALVLKHMLKCILMGPETVKEPTMMTENPLNIRERKHATVASWAKPCNNLFSTFIYILHPEDDSVTFVNIILIDTDRIDPDSPLFVGEPKVP